MMENKELGPEFGCSPEFKSVVKINKSILNYFKMIMDFDNESQEYRDVTEQEFINELTKALNCGTAKKTSLL